MSFSFRMISPPQPDASYTPLIADAPEYYQVNNNGMDILYSVMTTASVLDEDCEPPDFDETLPDWMDEERVEDIMDALEFGDEPDPPLTEKEREAIEQARNAQETLLQTSSPNQGQVPAFKFCSNDGWVVNAAECKAIHSAIVSLKEDPEALATACQTNEAKAVVESWGEFVRVAETVGGFTVS